jgi:hypothetical protein
VEVTEDRNRLVVRKQRQNGKKDNLFQSFFFLLLGDIDVLVTHPDYVSTSTRPNFVKKVVNALHRTGLMTDDISLGGII